MCRCVGVGMCVYRYMCVGVRVGVCRIFVSLFYFTAICVCVCVVVCVGV